MLACMHMLHAARRTRKTDLEDGVPFASAYVWRLLSRQLNLEMVIKLLDLNYFLHMRSSRIVTFWKELFFLAMLFLLIFTY